MRGRIPETSAFLKIHIKYHYIPMIHKKAAHKHLYIFFASETVLRQRMPFILCDPVT